MIKSYLIDKTEIYEINVVILKNTSSKKYGRAVKKTNSKKLHINPSD